MLKERESAILSKLDEVQNDLDKMNLEADKVYNNRILKGSDVKVAVKELYDWAGGLESNFLKASVFDNEELQYGSEGYQKEWEDFVMNGRSYFDYLAREDGRNYIEGHVDYFDGYPFDERIWKRLDGDLDKLNSSWENYLSWFNSRDYSINRHDRGQVKEMKRLMNGINKSHKTLKKHAKELDKLDEDIAKIMEPEEKLYDMKYDLEKELEAVRAKQD